jgi:nucleotide-binding universal stress UspA family protein
MCHNILLAADGSPSSLKAAEAAASLARLTPGSTVTDTSRPIFDTTDEIVQMARTAPCDLIVMGTRGLSALRQILLVGERADSYGAGGGAPCCGAPSFQEGLP